MGEDFAQQSHARKGRATLAAPRLELGTGFRPKGLRSEERLLSHGSSHQTLGFRAGIG
jgi:hypothetical protein